VSNLSFKAIISHTFSWDCPFKLNVRRDRYWISCRLDILKNQELVVHLCGTGTPHLIYNDDILNLITACVELGLKTADLLKLFNSRACQLVLGAGAVSLAGLKTITIRWQDSFEIKYHIGTGARYRYRSLTV
jgi:Vps54-like protein